MGTPHLHLLLTSTIYRGILAVRKAETYQNSNILMMFCFFTTASTLELHNKRIERFWNIYVVSTNIRGITIRNIFLNPHFTENLGESTLLNPCLHIAHIEVPSWLVQMNAQCKFWGMLACFTVIYGCTISMRKQVPGVRSKEVLSWHEPIRMSQECHGWSMLVE